MLIVKLFSSDQHLVITDMKQILNFVPLICFFVFLSLYDIFVGVKALIISSTIALFLCLIIYKKIEKMEIFSYLMIMIFGVLTLYFHNADFIKWKVVLINFAFALALLISQFIFKKNLIQKILGKELKLDIAIWNNLNIAWATFFTLCGIASLYVTYQTSTEFFGIFKTFILPGLNLAFTLISVLYIYKKMDK